MKKMRKLIPAFAMLMVAAIMMSTASFAWFSMNTTASATGMQIKAKSTGGLAIASYTGTVGATPVAPGDTAYLSSTSAVWKNSTDAVEPTSHNGSTWYKAQADKVDNFATTKGYIAVPMAGTGADGAGYFIKTKWSIKSLAESGNTPVSVSGITVTGFTKIVDETPTNIAGLAELAKSIRIAINVGSTWTYFAPLYAENPDGVTFKCVASETGTQNASLVFGTAPNQSILTLSGNTAQDVDVYIYFEGEDTNCKSSNAINLAALTVDLTFTAGTTTP